MNILYFGKVCDEELYEHIETTKKKPYTVAQYSYEKAFCDEACKKNNMTIVSIYQMRHFPKDRFTFFRKKHKFNNTSIKYLKYINIPYIKEMMYFILTCTNIISWNIKNRKQKDKCILINTHFAPVSAGIVLMSKLLNIKRYVTFTDLSLFTYSEEKIKKMKFYKKIIIKPYVKLVNKLQESYDGYILFSKAMDKIVNPNNKPSIVIEGIFNANDLDFLDVKKERAILHAGTLNKEVGIENILKVFSRIEDADLQLWLIGNGDMNDEICEYAKLDSRIKFIGFISKKEVFKYLKKATLLINLRNPNDEYTKYSFPSKNFEYMASGTPYLTTKLEGIPEEYYDYLYMVDDLNEEKILKKIEKIFQKSKQELDDFGKKAQKFRIEEKNAEKQTEKIIKFLNDCKGENNE